MDTQGIFDGESTMKDYINIFSLSNLLSSVQVRKIKRFHINHFSIPPSSNQNWTKTVEFVKNVRKRFEKNSIYVSIIWCYRYTIWCTSFRKTIWKTWRLLSCIFLLIHYYKNESSPRTLSSEGSLAIHTYCETDHSFIMVISEDPWHSQLLPSVWQWSFHYLFLRLRSFAAGIRTPNLPLARRTF